MTCGSGRIEASSAHPADGVIAENENCLLARISSSQGHSSAARKLRQSINIWMLAFLAQFFHGVLH